MFSLVSHRTVVIILIGIHLLLLTIFAMVRIVDNDEGFYLSAAKQTAEGKTVYRDFFYPQMPYLPYLFAPLSGLGMATLFLTRLAGVMASAITAILFYLLLIRMVSRQGMQIFVLCLYLFSGLVLSWHAVTKTYPWTDLCLMASLFFALHIPDGKGLLSAVLSGLAIALAVNIRLVLLPFIFLIGLHLYYASSKSLKRVLGYAAGVVAASIPMLFIFFADSGRFLFDNLGFHLMRDPHTAFGQSLLNRVVVLLKLAVNPQIAILLALAVIAIASARGRKRPTAGSISSPLGLVTILAIGMAVIYLLPNPIHQQYFVQAVPFALLAIAPRLEDSLLDRISGGLATMPRLAGLIVAVYILGLAPYFAIFIGGIRANDGVNTPARIAKVCTVIDQREDLGLLLGEWPLFYALSNRETISQVAFIGYDYKLRLSNAEKGHYNLPSDSSLNALISTRQFAHLIVRDSPEIALGPAVSANYALLETVAPYRIYERK